MLLLLLFSCSNPEETKTDDPTDAVVDSITGETTNETELIKGISVDLNSDGKMDTNDLYGLINGEGGMGWFWATGNIMMPKDADNRPYLDMPTERQALAFDKVYELVNGPYTHRVWHSAEPENIAMFSNNQGLFLTHHISSVQRLRDMDVDFGIIPYPKLDKNQEKYTCDLDTFAPIMGVPVNVLDPERTGAIIEALSYYAYVYQVSAYYEVNLKTKFARDDESSEMLDIIFDGRVFDFGLIYDTNWTLSAEFAAGIAYKQQNFISRVEKKLNAAQKVFDKALAAYDEID